MANFQIAVEVTTEPTGPDGVRHSAESNWSINSAPEGYVIDDRSCERHITGAAGSDKDKPDKIMPFEFDNYVSHADMPQVRYPKTIRVKAYARGPEGHSTGRGWTKGYVSGNYIKFNHQ